MLFRDQYPRKNGLWNHWSLFHLEESYLLDLFLSRCISFSPLSGLTKFITSMDSCFWSSLSWQLSLFVLPLFALISFWMPRIIDGNCSFLFIYFETVITIYFFKDWKPNFFYYRQWTSFLAAGSTSGYVYMYSIYYFFFKTK